MQCGHLETEGVQPDCVLERHAPGQLDSERVPECTQDDDGYVVADGRFQMPSEADDVCYALQVDDGSTASEQDDVHPLCVEEGFNLSVVLERRPGTVPDPGEIASVRCKLSNFPQQDCAGS